jgi:hypothetical protein
VRALLTRKWEEKVGLYYPRNRVFFKAKPKVHELEYHSQKNILTL